MSETTDYRPNRFTLDFEGVISGKIDMHVWRSRVLVGDLIRVVPVEAGGALDPRADDGIELYAPFQPYYDGLMTREEAEVRLQRHLSAAQAFEDGNY